MSKYTTQLRWIIEESVQDLNITSISDKINASREKIFDFEYPIWENQYKPILERKILFHYFNEEIALETPALFKLYLEERLNLIMPYYNDLYKTTIYDYDPLTDIDLTEIYRLDKKAKQVVDSKNVIDYESDEKIKSNSDRKLSGDFDSKTTDKGTINNVGSQNKSVIDDGTTESLTSDLPQVTFATTDYGSNSTDTKSKNTNTTDDKTTNVETRDLTGTAKNITNDNENIDINTDDNILSKTDGKIDTITDDTANDDYYNRKTGNSGKNSFTELMGQYRDRLINIDKMIVYELEDLFMGVW